MLRTVYTAFILCINFLVANGQNADSSTFTSNYVEIKGLRVHYLDFGGSGLPVILVHSESWSAYTYKNFGPLLTDQNRVLAFTRPGYGESEKGKYDVPSQGDYLIAFADALGIERAIFMGNSSVSSELTYLAEHYPDRVAGLVYFSGIAIPGLDVHLKDSTRAYEMFMRAAPGDNNKEEIALARRTYRPLHLTSDTVRLKVPALAFVSRSGLKNTEIGAAALLFIGSPLMEDVRNELPPSPTKDFLVRIAAEEDFRNEQINSIRDSVARSYFKKLADDISLQEKVYEYYRTYVKPAELAARQSFIDAFGEQLQLVRIDADEVIGYEYRDSPELIVEQLRAFILELNGD